jgi:hypothetical protein
MTPAKMILQKRGSVYLRWRLSRANDFVSMRCMLETAEPQLKGFIAKFDPAMGVRIRECR